MISILDYGLGNVLAFANIYKRNQVPFKIVSSDNDFSNTTKLILPGVGAFDEAMIRFNKSNMRSAVEELVLKKEVPILGVCVGMQMMASSSDEGSLPGLGWLDASVKKFSLAKRDDLPLPHMGWNRVKIINNHPVFDGMNKRERFYFLHSYYVSCNSSTDISAVSAYPEEFCSVFIKNNLFGIQCHPEKSHKAGVKFLLNFARL